MRGKHAAKSSKRQALAEQERQLNDQRTQNELRERLDKASASSDAAFEILSSLRPLIDAFKNLERLVIAEREHVAELRSQRDELRKAGNRLMAAIHADMSETGPRCEIEMDWVKSVLDLKALGIGSWSNARSDRPLPQRLKERVDEPSTVIPILPRSCDPSVA